MPSCDAIIIKSVYRQSDGLSNVVLATVTVSKASHTHTHTVAAGAIMVTRIALLRSLYYI